MLLLLTLAISTLLAATPASSQSDSFKHVTCGSAVKLTNNSSKMRLHSHEINWGSGSGQQSVTTHGSIDDPNSLWLVRGPHGQNDCVRGSQIACGSTIRLQHALTGRNLHSHSFKSPVSNNQEISAFGENWQGGSPGFGDAGDNWIVECEGGTWQRGSITTLRHAVTNAYLSASRRFQFNQNNCRGCPIVGQGEAYAAVSSASSRDEVSWIADFGIYFTD